MAQRFRACLWPRARFWRPGIESHVGLPMHGACFFLRLCLCLSLSLSVTIINKFKKKLKKKKPRGTDAPLRGGWRGRRAGSEPSPPTPPPPFQSLHMRCCSPTARFILLQFLSPPGAKQAQRCSLDRSAQTRPTRPARCLGNHIYTGFAGA